MNHFSITSIIRSIILEDSLIKNLVGEKVYPLQAPKDTIGDFILYQRDGYVVENTKMGVATQKPLVFLNVVSEDYDIGQLIAGYLYNALIGSFHLSEENPNNCITISLEDSTEDIVDKKYVQVLLIKIEI